MLLGVRDGEEVDVETAVGALLAVFGYDGQHERAFPRIVVRFLQLDVDRFADAVGIEHHLRAELSLEERFGPVEVEIAVDSVVVITVELIGRSLREIDFHITCGIDEGIERHPRKAEPRDEFPCQLRYFVLSVDDLCAAVGQVVIDGCHLPVRAVVEVREVRRVTIGLQVIVVAQRQRLRLSHSSRPCEEHREEKFGFHTGMVWTILRPSFRCGYRDHVWAGSGAVRRGCTMRRRWAVRFLHQRCCWWSRRKQSGR